MTITMTHKPECMCVRCLNEDIDRALLAQGIDPARFPAGPGVRAPEPDRTAGSGLGYGRATTGPEITPGQRELIANLRRERDTTGVVVPADLDKLTAAQVRTLINALFACPRISLPPAPERRPTAAHVDLEPGMYLAPDGRIIRVQKSKESGKAYGKVAVVEQEAERAADGTVITPAVIRFDYAPGATVGLTPEHRMTFEQARAFGALHGVCVFGHALTDPLSVAAGIGPKCAAQWGYDRVALAAAAGYVAPSRRRKAAAPAA